MFDVWPKFMVGDRSAENGRSSTESTKPKQNHSSAPMKGPPCGPILAKKSQPKDYEQGRRFGETPGRPMPEAKPPERQDGLAC